MGLTAVALIGQANNPLYIKTAAPDSSLKIQHAIYSSLDVIQEKVANAGKTPSVDRDMFLGLLFPADEQKIYGYVTATHIKLVLVLDDSNIADRDIRRLFRTVHDLYIKLVCNPFYTANTPITSKQFDRAITALCNSPES